MKIALDVYGGDFGPAPNLEGALAALKSLDCDIILVGKDNEIRELLSRLDAPQSARIQVIHAPQVIEMAGEPVQECRSKPDSSLVMCAELVADKKADAFVSAGNSGAAMVASLLKMKRLPGVMRPAITVPFPTIKGTAVLLDAGANMDSKPWHLVQFAVMGSVYARHILKKNNPSVGILSVGEEETKGNDLVRETIPLLKKSGLNYCGPVEGRDLPAGKADVVVCDGFVGNICLKVSEGIAKTIVEMLKEEINRSFAYKLAALAMKGAFQKLKKRVNSDEWGGAPLLGVNGTAIICHGKSNAAAIYNGIRTANDFAKAKANAEIIKTLESLRGNIDASKEEPLNI